MKRTLYLKLVGGYLIFILLSFLAVTLFMYQTTYQYLEQQEANNLYRALPGEILTRAVLICLDCLG